MATTYYFSTPKDEVSLDLEEGIETIFHEDYTQFFMEQDIQTNGFESVYFS